MSGRMSDPIAPDAPPETMVALSRASSGGRILFSSDREGAHDIFVMTHAAGPEPEIRRQGTPGDDAPERPAQTADRSRWARLIARIYEAFPLSCPDCGAEMRILAFLTDSFTVVGILRHLGLPHTAPPLTAARSPPRDQPALEAEPFLDLDQTPAFDPTEPEPIPDWPPITAHPATTPTATSASLRFDFDQTRGA